jgi:hypothetical protein
MQVCGLDESGSGQGPVARSCEERKKPWSRVKGREYIYKMSDDYLHMNDFAPSS